MLQPELSQDAALDNDVAPFGQAGMLAGLGKSTNASTLPSSSQATPTGDVSNAPPSGLSENWEGAMLLAGRQGNPTPQSKVDEIVGRYQRMIVGARARGWNVAADNLQHWLSGGGQARTIDVGWLRGFDSVTSAERENQGRFENALNGLANGLARGASTTHRDYWDATNTAALDQELYFASGTFTVTSTGTFRLQRSQSGTLTITGSISHRWWDEYDWHAGLFAAVPGFGSVSDADALLVEQQRGARPFSMAATWNQALQYSNGRYTWIGP